MRGRMAERSRVAISTLTLSLVVSQVSMGANRDLEYTLEEDKGYQGEQ